MASPEARHRHYLKNKETPGWYNEHKRKSREYARKKVQTQK